MITSFFNFVSEKQETILLPTSCAPIYTLFNMSLATYYDTCAKLYTINIDYRESS